MNLEKNAFDQLWVDFTVKCLVALREKKYGELSKERIREKAIGEALQLFCAEIDRLEKLFYQVHQDLKDLEDLKSHDKIFH